MWINWKCIHTILKGIYTWNNFYQSTNSDIRIKFNYDVGGILFFPNNVLGDSDILYNQRDIMSAIFKEKLCKYFDKLTSCIIVTYDIVFNVTYKDDYIFTYTKPYLNISNI